MSGNKDMVEMHNVEPPSLEWLTICAKDIQVQAEARGVYVIWLWSA